jgi:hypothetical protein
MQGQHANVGRLRPHWNDQNIKNSELPKIDRHKILLYHKLFTSSTELFLQKSRVLHNAVTVAKVSDISASAVRQIFRFLFHVGGEKTPTIGWLSQQKGQNGVSCFLLVNNEK